MVAKVFWQHEVDTYVVEDSFNTTEITEDQELDVAALGHTLCIYVVEDVREVVDQIDIVHDDQNTFGGQLVDQLPRFWLCPAETKEKYERIRSSSIKYILFLIKVTHTLFRLFSNFKLLLVEVDKNWLPSLNHNQFKWLDRKLADN